MLSNITSYLFGGQAGNANPEKENVNFHEVEEDDWMLIDKLVELSKSGESDNLIVSSETFISIPPTFREQQSSRPPVPEKNCRRRSISCKRLVNRRCSTPLRELSPACVNTKAVVPYVAKKESRSSSKSSLYGMEESWYITPPPCFVSGPYETKPSSLENLLIEQPGVHFLSKYQKADKIPRRTEEVQKCTNSSIKATLEELFQNKNKAITLPPSCGNGIKMYEDKRRQLLELHEQKKFINSCQSQISAAQKMEQKLPDQFCKRNQMERANKVQHELSSRKKRQRRADLNKKHSGVNNNRKCCY